MTLIEMTREDCCIDPNLTGATDDAEQATKEIVGILKDMEKEA